MINVSHNELITQCTKAFEGLQRQCGEADKSDRSHVVM